MKFNKYTYIILMAMLFCSCQSKNQGLALFNEYYFHLSGNEEVVEPDSVLRSAYLTHVNSFQLQIPLFKTIKDSNYTLFVGIPYNSNMARIKESLKDFNWADSLAFKTDSSAYLYANYKQDSTYILEYVKSIDKNMVYVYAMSKSKQVKDSIFNLKEISNRIRKNGGD